MSTATRNDAELVGESLSGNRDAFGQIVSRYQSPKLAWLIGMMMMMMMCGVITLAEYNVRQYQSGLGAANGALPAEVIIFNLVVVVVYAVFAGFLIWKRKCSSSS